MAFSLLLLLGAAFIVGSTFAFFRRTRRNILLQRLYVGGRRVSGARTPPRSLSPSKKPEISPETDYSTTFPPSRRSALASILKDDELDEPAEDWTNKILPTETSYLDANETSRLPSGISIKEIKALGDFPDYATLSGVPLPAPYPEFDIARALPRPYRPFRWPYHQTMCKSCTRKILLYGTGTEQKTALTKMQADWWIELENTYVERMQQRKALFTQHGKDVLDALPGTELACKELMEMVVQFICARYPHYFSLSPDKKVLRNEILGTQTHLGETHPLHVLLENVPEDFAIMQRDDKTGRYMLRAGVICSALGWNLGSKMGRNLASIHAPIPDYKEKMQFSMDR